MPSEFDNNGTGFIDEFAENSIDSIPEPTAEDLLTVSIHTIVDQVSAAWIANPPVADLHPSGHMFNRINGVNFCACDCEYCNGPILPGKHYPSCICTDCECDG